MARAPAGLPAGIRLGDHLSPGVIAKAFTPAACDYPYLAPDADNGVCWGQELRGLRAGERRVPITEKRTATPRRPTNAANCTTKRI